MSNNVCFESSLTKCHLRAISIEKQFLFVGFGSTLQVFKTNQNGLKELVLTQRVFKTFILNSIQTFVDFESDSEISIKVLITGNRFLTVYGFAFNADNGKTSLNPLLESHNFYDWILLVRVIGNFVFIVKAHNEVVVFDWKTNQIIDTISGTDKCILYSAELLLVSESPKGFVLSSGTVFKEIVVWTSVQSQTNSGFVSESLQRLRGHDGVIFALNYSKALNLLVSASDDRSVRIWSSGLDSNDSVDWIEFWSKNRFSLSHVFYGHSARIWTVRALNNPYPMAISVGEDSSLCFWNINEKKLIQKMSGHKNSSIWSLNLDTNSMIAFCGGSDSSLTSYDILNTITPFNCVVSIELDPKQVVFTRVANLSIFCTTIGGDFALISTNDSNRKPIRNSDYKQIFENYSAIDVNRERNRILLGSKCGNIAIIDMNCNFEKPYEVQIKRVQNSKVFSICFVDSFHFLSCGFGGEVKVWSLKSFTQIKECVLPHSRHRWPTAGLYHKQLLVVGDRCGSVFIYSDSNANPIKEFRHLHGSNGVTAIKAKPKTNLMYSSGRNGKIFEFLFEQNKCLLLRIFRLFSDMQWIANFEFDEQTNQISYIYGFESRNFVVWDERELRFIESIECGGGHRSWDFTVHQNRYYFCYTKQEKMFCLDKVLPKTRTDSNLSITQSSHSKKINCCSILITNSSMVYFATAGEDNDIHINSLNADTNESKVESYLFGHISNISAITCTRIQNSFDSCLMVSVGGRSQLMVWKIDIKDNEIICRQILNKFLWTSDNIQNRTQRLKSSPIDPQIRYLDANISQLSEHKYLISTACSDSAVRLFALDNNCLSFQLLNISSFNTSCVLRVLNIRNSYVITASNDGTLKIWALIEGLFANLTLDESEYKRLDLNSVFEMRLHESGINALDFFQINDNLWLIASGGDDNTLVLSLFESSSNSMTRVSSVEEKHIHCSQITGIRIVSKSTILSAAIDQRIIVWNYRLDSVNFNLELEPIASYISSIADISTLCSAVVPDQNKWQLIVCGEGFEAIKYSNTALD